MAKAIASNPRKVSLMRFAIKLMAAMPSFLSKALARFLAWYSRVSDSRSARTSRINIAYCLPELNSEQQKILLKKSLRHSAGLLPEIACIWNDPCSANKIQNVFGEQEVKAHLESGQSIMITGAHIGNWEIALFYLGMSFEFTCMYRRPRYLELDEVICQGRGKNTTKMVPGDAKGIRQFLKALKNSEVAALLSDQEPGGDSGIFAPFFRKPAKTMDLIQKIQKKSSAKLYQIAAIKNHSGKYDVHLEAIAVDSIEDPLEYATKVNLELENMVRRFPEQYQWSYKRFKSTEDGKPNIYR